jgi:farnesyl diphosphate synthase
MAEPDLLLKREIEAVAAETDRAFDLLLTPPGDSRDRLFHAMRHAAIGGGKRMRPLLVSAASRLFNVGADAALRVGCAIEAIHVYSLVHDDLPCMDDDDMRRGKPTVHKAFDEATAVLAGDALHALAFEWLAETDTHADPFVRAELILELARAAGPSGMAGGQMMDIAAESDDFDLQTVAKLQQLKTGALISFCLEAGAILGKVPPEGRAHLRAYARDIGLAFQIADDLLDVEGDADKVGKQVGKDADAGKATFVSLLGVDRAREQARMLVDQAVGHLAGYGAEADLLRAIARYVIERDH